MSDNLKVAKERGATVEDVIYPEGTVQRVTFHTNSALEAYTSRILASQQAAHEAEIASYQQCIKDEYDKREALDNQLSAANAACAMNDEALKAWEATFNKWIEGAAWHIGKEKLSFDEKRIAFFAVRDFVQEVISASPQQVSEWERKQLEPLRAQVAMLHTALSKASKGYPDGYFDSELSDTQATADQSIAECEQRGAVKALEELAVKMLEANDGTLSAFMEVNDFVLMLNRQAKELRATSKKAE